MERDNLVADGALTVELALLVASFEPALAAGGGSDGLATIGSDNDGFGGGPIDVLAKPRFGRGFAGRFGAVIRDVVIFLAPTALKDFALTNMPLPISHLK